MIMDTLGKVLLVFFSGVALVAGVAAIKCIYDLSKEMREARHRREMIAALQGWVPQKRTPKQR